MKMANAISGFDERCKFGWGIRANLLGNCKHDRLSPSFEKRRHVNEFSTFQASRFLAGGLLELIQGLKSSKRAQTNDAVL